MTELKVSTEQKSFVYYQSFLKSCRNLDAELFKELHIAIGEYALYGKEPSNLSGELVPFWELIVPQLEANRRRAFAGKKGGRPRKNVASNQSEVLKKTEPEAIIDAIEEKFMQSDKVSSEAIKVKQAYKELDNKLDKDKSIISNTETNETNVVKPLNYSHESLNPEFNNAIVDAINTSKKRTTKPAPSESVGEAFERTYVPKNKRVNYVDKGIEVIHLNDLSETSSDISDDASSDADYQTFKQEFVRKEFERQTEKLFNTMSDADLAKWKEQKRTEKILKENGIPVQSKHKWKKLQESNDLVNSMSPVLDNLVLDALKKHRVTKQKSNQYAYKEKISYLDGIEVKQDIPIKYNLIY